MKRRKRIELIEGECLAIIGERNNALIKFPNCVRDKVLGCDVTFIGNDVIFRKSSEPKKSINPDGTLWSVRLLYSLLESCGRKQEPIYEIWRYESSETQDGLVITIIPDSRYKDVATAELAQIEMGKMLFEDNDFHYLDSTSLITDYIHTLFYTERTTRGFRELGKSKGVIKINEEDLDSILEDFTYDLLDLMKDRGVNLSKSNNQ